MEEPQRLEILDHLNGCETCRVFVSLLAEDPDLTPEPDAPIGRFERFDLLAPLAQGGMGIVYRARDPELDRPVALKLVRDDGADEVSRGRLVREAQSMARVQHPNVARVYEVGSVGDEVYLVMELIDGPTLDLWLAQTERSLDEILAVFIDAGRGLAAAHGAGLVHRDFKPRNVLVDRDGRAHVTDFGLARPVAKAGPGEEPRNGRRPTTNTGDPGLTQGGGTPEYMAPEQLAGARSSKASDQYSYCVALYQALHGARPVPGAPLEFARRVPRELRRALARGLSVDPARRWPSMEALLAALVPPLPRRVRPVWIAIAAVAVAAAGAMAVAITSRPAATSGGDPCGAGDERTASVWNDRQRARVRDAFARSGIGWHAQAASAAIGSLDGQVAQWRALERDVCRSAQASATADETPALQRGCLARWRDELEAVVGLLADADEATVVRGPAAWRLASIDECRNGPLLRARAGSGRTIPVDVVRSIHRSLSVTRALLRVGRTDAADAVLVPVLAQLEQLDYPPLLAEALVRQGDIAYRRRDHDGLEKIIQRAVMQADAGAVDFWRAHAWLVLATSRIDRSDFAGAHQAIEQARPIVTRLQDPAALRTALLDAEAMVLGREGRLEEALARNQEAIGLVDRTDPVYPLIAANVAMSLVDLGRPDQARPYAETAIRQLEQTYRADHPNLALTIHILGAVHDEAGRLEEARQMYQRALDMQRRLLGPEHVETSETETVLGSLLVRMKRPAEALPLLRHALAVREQSVGVDNASLVYELNALGNGLIAAGEMGEARGVFERAREVCAGGECAEVALQGVEGGLAATGRK